MIANHISVFAENKPGRLEHITGILAEANINIRAIKISDLGEFGVIKVLVNDPDAAYQVLKDGHVSVSKKPIVVVIMDDRPGRLHEVFKILTQHNINVEDSYGFTIGEKGILVVEVANVPEVSDMLKHSGLHLLTKEEIYAL
ncbi:amino acid-binding ACT domain protein [Candidatus Vecturithrix granuli]|uniref:Amino acid-binding ACT domain protein n=1 Tax=Vecturithrix granuli TaxID=1499967 RepID=A0A081BZE7_VECG1|nr:amino acid-binding ACT domain protein [Candidatus Vecturithrix granuli]